MMTIMTMIILTMMIKIVMVMITIMRTMLELSRVQEAAAHLLRAQREEGGDQEPGPGHRDLQAARDTGRQGADGRDGELGEIHFTNIFLPFVRSRHFLSGNYPTSEFSRIWWRKHPSSCSLHHWVQKTERQVLEREDDPVWPSSSCPEIHSPSPPAILSRVQREKLSSALRWLLWK